MEKKKVVQIKIFGGTFDSIIREANLFLEGIDNDRVRSVTYGRDATFVNNNTITIVYEKLIQ